MNEPWGTRGWLCRSCRTAHAGPATCCFRPTIDLADADAREQLARRVWWHEPRSIWYALRRRRFRRALERAWGKLRSAFGAPHGSYPSRLRPPRDRALSGIARGTARVPPFGGAPCLAYGLELRADRHRLGPIMLRDAASAGFTVELDDGRVVRVPAGPLLVVMDDAPVEPIDTATHHALLAWLAAAPAAESRPAIPHDTVHTRRISAGDRIELWAELAPSDASYRDTPPLLARPPIWIR